MFLSRIGTFMWDSLDLIILRSYTMLRLSDITGIMFSRFFGEQRATKECAEKITRCACLAIHTRHSLALACLRNAKK